MSEGEALQEIDFPEVKLSGFYDARDEYERARHELMGWYAISGILREWEGAQIYISVSGGEDRNVGANIFVQNDEWLKQIVDRLCQIAEEHTREKYRELAATIPRLEEL